MATNVERFLIGTNNLVRVELQEDGQPIPNLQNATQVDITIKDVLISRTTSPDRGVDYTQGGGILEINPAQLTEDLSSLPLQFVPTVIRVYDGDNPEGAIFGGADSDPRLMFSVRQPIG